MKRFTAITIVFLLILTTALSGCTQNERETERKTSVVCTVFPQYDWVSQILGDNADDVELTLLLNKRIDLHNYQPSVDDIIKISTCDLFIYIGGESDKWVDDALKDATNKDMIVISLLEMLGDAAKAEEIIEGMEEDLDDADDNGEEIEYDEHVWLSLRNAQIFCSAITNALSSLDAENAGTYRSNLALYNEKLSAFDSDYKAALNDAPVDTLLFGDRFPFRYLVDDYGLNYYAAFAGCSAETEASFETIIFLAKRMDELGLKTIMVTESSDKRIAETIIRESQGADIQVLVLDSMQSVAKSDVTNGTTYLSIIESNLNVLKEALK